MNENAIAIRDDMSVSDIAKNFIQSGFFQDTRDVSQAIVKIMAGREFGYGPFASMTGIHIIQGRPSLGANLMASAVKQSGRYDYRVREMDDKACTIEFFQRVVDKWDSLGKSVFTLDDARKAGTKNLDKFPRNMLFARAMSNGVRWFCPDAFNGAAVYTPEELGAEVDAEGNVIEGTFVTPEHKAEVQLHSEDTLIDNATTTVDGRDHKKFNGDSSRPYGLETIKAKLSDHAKSYKGTPTDKQIGLIAMLLEKAFVGRDNAAELRHEVQFALFGHESLKDCEPGILLAALNIWLKPTRDSGGDYLPDQMAIKEIQRIHTESLSAEGQQTLI